MKANSSNGNGHHEVVLAFDPGDPNLPPDEFYRCIMQMVELMKKAGEDQVQFLIDLSDMAIVRYTLIKGLCELELARRPAERT